MTKKTISGVSTHLLSLRKVFFTANIFDLKNHKEYYGGDSNYGWAYANNSYLTKQR